MSVVHPPNSREIQEFQFKLLARLRFFDETQAPPIKQPLKLVVAASKFGLICVGTSTGFDVVETAKIVEQCVGVKKPTVELNDFPRRKVLLGAQPTHLDLSCDYQYLAVGFGTAGGHVIRVYDVTSFTAQSERVLNEVRLPGPLQALCWNPGIPNLLATCLQDGSAFVYDFKNNSVDISSIPPESQSTCLCWSPKGKQIVIGSRNGALNQFMPELKIVKTIPSPQSGNSVVSVQWLSNFQYAAVYCASSGGGPALVLVNTPKGQPITYVNYEDITYSNGNNRTTEFYFIHQQTWNVLLVGSSNSMEVGVLGLQGCEWHQWLQEDAARAELPLSPKKQETHPVGMALDVSVQHNLQWGENQHLPPMPLLLILSHDGLLSLYWSLNMLQGAVSVCVPPSPLPDTTGAHLFTTPVSTTVVPPEPNQIETSPALPTPVQPTPVQPVAEQPVPVQTPQLGWGQAAALTPPKATQQSWMMSPPSVATMMSPATQLPTTNPPSFWAKAFNPVSSAPPTFSITSSAASTPFSFTSDSVSKPGVLVSPTAAQTTTAITAAPAPSALDKVDIPGVPPLAPTPAAAPKPEIVEESQELEAMNAVLIEEAIRDAMTLFTNDMNQQRQTYKSRRINEVVDTAALEKLSEDIDNWLGFVREVADTTKVQHSEVNSLRSFLVDIFTYVENLKTRLHIQNNPDYLSLQSPDMADPIMARKIVELRASTQFIKSQLTSIDRQISDKWNKFKDSNKENRESMHIPSLEAIYQSIVMQNNVLMKQIGTVDDLERQIKVCQRERLRRMLNLSRMVDETEDEESEFSQVLQELVALSVNSSSINISSLEKAVLNLSVNSHTLSDSKRVPKERVSERMAMLDQMFKDNTVKYLEPKSMLPIVTASPLSGSISLGQPVFQNNLQKVSPEDSLKTPTKDERAVFNVASKGNAQTKQKSPFSISSSPGNSQAKVFGVDNIVETSSPFQNVLSSSSNTVGSLTKTTTSNIPTNSPFNFSFTCTASTSSTPQLSQAPAGNGFYFATLPSSQTAFSSPSFGPSAQLSSASNAPFGSKPSLALGLSTAATAVTSTTTFTINTSSFATEVSKSQTIPSSNSSLFKIAPAENTSNNIAPASKLSGNTNPLAALSSFVSGIETLKTSDHQISFPANISQSASVITTSTTNEVPLFNVSRANENVDSTEKDQSVLTQKPQTIFGSLNQNKAEFKTPKLTAVKTEQSSSEGNNKLGGTLKNLELDSTPVKSIFGGNAQPTVPGQAQKGVFTFSSPSTSGLFSTVTPSSSVLEKDQMVKPDEGSCESASQIIEISLSSSSKSELDPKLSFEKLSAKKDLIITKLESTDKSLASEGLKSKESDKSNSLFTPFSSSLTTPTKSVKTIFGGSPPEVVLPTYQIQQTESGIGLSTDKKEDPKPDDSTKQQDKSKTNSGTESNKSNQSGLSFETNISESKTASSSSTNTNPTQVTSSFSFSQLGTQPASTGFTFTIPSTNTSVTPTNIFGFGNLTTESSEDKSKTGFSFGQVQSPVSSTGNIFGGVTSKPAGTSSIFGGQSTTVETKGIFSTTPATSTATTETKSVFGQSQPTTENKNLFGQSETTQAENKTLFGVPSTTSADTKSIFGQTATVGAANTSIFGQTSTVLSENKTVFGLPTSTPTDTKNIFGQTSVTTEGKSVFGLALPASSENKSIFGQSTATTTQGNSLFGQSTAPLESKSIFGQTTAATTESNSVFGQSSPTQSKNIFGQTATTTSDLQSAFSFSLGVSTTSAQPSFFGTPATTAASSFFGQPICSPASTASSPFGQSTSTPAFGSASQSPFGSTSTFGSKPTFGQSGGSFFGQSSGGFGSNSSSVFGGGSPSVFGGNNTQSNTTFGSTSGGSGGSMFGGGSFSAGGAGVAQTGFGTTNFQNKPAFGSPNSSASFGAPPAFGAAPTFGGSASFGSPTKVFGSPTAAPSVFGNAPQQQSSTFESLANQNTMTFGNLAQNQTSSFGSVFSQPQTTTPSPAFPPASTGSAFGGSSFSSWR